MKNSFLKITLAALVSLVSYNSAFAENNTGDSSRRRERHGSYVIAKAPLLLSSGLDFGTYISSNKAVGLTLDVDSYVVLTTGFAGPYLRLYAGNSFYFQNGVGVFINSLSRDYRAVGLNSAIGNEWLFDSGFLIGGEWLGVNLMHAVKQGDEFVSQGVFPTFPKLRIGYAF